MSKKKTGLLIVFGAAIGAAAACVSYYAKYKSFSNELDKDFHDYEEEDECGAEEEKECSVSSETAKRNYITIDSCKCQEPENSQEEVSKQEETAGKMPDKAAADVTIEEDMEGIKE